MNCSQPLRLITLAMTVLLFWAGSPDAKAQQAPSFKTPGEAIQAVQKSIENNDYQLFQQAVDLKSITEHAVKHGVPLLKEQAASGQMDLPPAAALLLASADLTSPEAHAMLVQVLLSELRPLLKYGIESGAFKGDQKMKYTNPSVLFSHASLSKKTLIAGKMPRNPGDTFIAPAMLKDDDAGVFHLALGMSKGNDGWRITSIENLPALLQSATSRKNN